ncbi:HpcH/HpaI aldolase/citrate lyase family protein [Nocardioides sp. DS6]|uniref:HpcH/HpaI aldolase/citrate lyase family protein n=1 Tax=Nocardioides eburneus TaxID=3231482 RepID=A0ABV3T358_9ACTN
MRHFPQLAQRDLDALFHRVPQPFGRQSDLDTLAMALGATLYMPATRPRLADDLVKQAAQGVMSSVVCLEDAIADSDLPAAQDNVVRQLAELGRRDPEAESFPLTFVRVRHPDQIGDITTGLGEHARLLSGFVLPKFTDETGSAFLDALEDVRQATGLPLLAMPVIESPGAIYRESRQDTLLGVAQLLAKHRDLVLAVRLGATDLSSAYGLRRSRDLTVYDVPLVAEVIMDVVNVLGRADGTGYVVTGPVWEHFVDQDRLFKPRLRQTPFVEQGAARLRQTLVTRDLDGLIREIVLDKANGLTGKTVIHPTHVLAVHALSVVTHEEWSDACDILGHDMSGGGVRASAYRNKMNEAKPHRAWAERTLRRARLFGVAAEDVGFVDLLVAGVSATR